MPNWKLLPSLHLFTSASRSPMMTPVPLSNIWFALLLLAGEYVLLGWYLAAHHVFGLIGVLMLAFTVALTRRKNPILDGVTWLMTQQVFVVIVISFVLSLIIALAYIKPMILSLSLLPFTTLLYALLEMRSANFQESQVLLWTVLITCLGLTLGEAIDLFVTPSIRY